MWYNCPAAVPKQKFSGPPIRSAKGERVHFAKGEYKNSGVSSGKD